MFVILTTIATSKLISPIGPYHSDPDEITEAKFINHYLNLSASQILDLAHQPNAMFRKCEMNVAGGSKKCYDLMEGATKIFAPKHGICYKFNSVLKNQMNKSLAIENTGQANGLHLDIDIDGIKMI